MQTSNGLGVVTYESATLVTLGGCPIENRAPMYTLTQDAAAQVCLTISLLLSQMGAWVSSIWSILLLLLLPTGVYLLRLNASACVQVCNATAAAAAGTTIPNLGNASSAEACRASHSAPLMSFSCF